MEAQRPGDAIPDGISKAKWKKLLKKQRFEQGRAEWKRKQKEKDDEKKRKRRKAGLPRATPVKKHKMSDATASRVKVTIELGYQDLMTDMDIRSLIKQCQRCYAANRRAESPLQLYFTSFGGRLKQRMEQTLQGYTKWDVYFKAADYVEEFGSENIVYLVAESPNVLSDLAPDKVYVIGGLVDHNHHMGHCYHNALLKGVAHAQLPISDYITLNSRKVLTVNHVFEILVAFVQHRDWKMAFHKVIPLRKQTTESSQASKSPSLAPESSHPASSSSAMTQETTSVTATTSSPTTPLEPNHGACCSVEDSLSSSTHAELVSDTTNTMPSTTCTTLKPIVSTVEPVITTSIAIQRNH